MECLDRDPDHHLLYSLYNCMGSIPHILPITKVTEGHSSIWELHLNESAIDLGGIGPKRHPVTPPEVRCDWTLVTYQKIPPQGQGGWYMTCNSCNVLTAYYCFLNTVHQTGGILLVGRVHPSFAPSACDSNAWKNQSLVPGPETKKHMANCLNHPEGIGRADICH